MHSGAGCEVGDGVDGSRVQGFSSNLESPGLGLFEESSVQRINTFANRSRYGGVDGTPRAGARNCLISFQGSERTGWHDFHAQARASV
jgi:hypothetical protein